MIKIDLQEAIEKTLKVLEMEAEEMEIQLEHPGVEEHGDYSSNIALAMFGNIKNQISNIKNKEDLLKVKSPRELAERLVEALKNDKELGAFVSKIEVAGPGFINFYFKSEFLLGELTKISVESENFGRASAFKDQKLMIEFAHPNTHKQFHLGHLRNIITGEALCRIFKSAGADVIRANYQGDVGLHIAKALYGIQKIGFNDPQEVKQRMEFLGKAYVTGSKAYEEDENSKKEIQEINKKIYDKSDVQINEVYKVTRKWSLDYFENIYHRVYTTFDRYYFESEVYESGKEIALKAYEDGILEKSDGAIVFMGSKFGLHDRVFLTSVGVPTYEAKDLGLAKLQFEEYDPKMVIHVLGPEQLGYTQVLFKALEKIQPETKDRELHLPYGWVKLKEGKMSSRTGNVVLGEWLLDEIKSKVKEIFEGSDEVTEQVAIAAVKYSFLKTNLSQEIAFDFKESISLDGNSGPYLQYTYARCRSVVGKAEVKGPAALTHPPRPSADGRGALLIEGISSEELRVVRWIYRFPEVVEKAAKEYAPNVICTFLFELAQRYNAFYNQHSVLNADTEEQKKFRLLVTKAVAQVLKNGLGLLGIEAPERM